jgi:hypothetical protein
MATIRTGTASSAFLAEGSDDTKTVALHRVIGDPRHIAEIDDPALEGLEPLGVCRADRQQRERGGKGGLLDIHGSYVSPEIVDACTVRGPADIVLDETETRLRP